MYTVRRMRTGASLAHDVGTRVHAEMESDGELKTNKDAGYYRSNRTSFRAASPVHSQ